MFDMTKAIWPVRSHMVSYLTQHARRTLFIVIPANTKYLCNICTMSDQRRRRWADVVQMPYKCFVFAGIHLSGGPTVHVPFPDDISESVSLIIFILHTHIPPQQAPEVVLMLVNRLRRWPSIKTTVVQHLVFAGLGGVDVPFGVLTFGLISDLRFCGHY